MNMSDPIAGMLVCVRNTQAMEKASMVMSSSKLKVAVAKVSKDEDYIDELTVAEQGGKSTLMIGLKYCADHPIIERLERVLKPGLRVYKGRNKIPRVMNGLDVTVTSTLQGLMTDRRTRATGIGGGVIYYVA